MPTEIVTICLMITAGFVVSEMLSTGTYHTGLRGSQSVPTEMAAVGPAASPAQLSTDTVQSEPPGKVWYKSAVPTTETGLQWLFPKTLPLDPFALPAGPTEPGLEWMFPKTPPLHLLDMRNRL